MQVSVRSVMECSGKNYSFSITYTSPLSDLISETFLFNHISHSLQMCSSQLWTSTKIQSHVLGTSVTLPPLVWSISLELRRQNLFPPKSKIQFSLSCTNVNSTLPCFRLPWDWFSSFFSRQSQYLLFTRDLDYLVYVLLFSVPGQLGFLNIYNILCPHLALELKHHPLRNAGSVCTGILPNRTIKCFKNRWRKVSLFFDKYISIVY